MDVELKHYGVKGMRWGVTKGSGGSKGRATVKRLQSEIKTKKRARWEKDSATMARREKRAYEKINATYKKKLRQVSSTQVSSARGYLKRSKIRRQRAKAERNVVSKVEAKYFNSKKKRKKAFREAESRLDLKLANMWTKRYNKEVKGKGFLEGFKALQKMDREMTQLTLEAYLELERKHA